MRIVVDTNVLVSGFFFGGAPGKIVDAISAGDVIPCFTLETWKELQRVVLDEKFDRIRARCSFTGFAFLARLQQRALLFSAPPRPREPIVARDSDDDAFILCAMASRAAFLISGDAAVRALGSFAGIPIVTPAEFLNSSSI